MVDPAVANKGLPSQIWHPRDGVSSYRTLPEFLQSVADMQATGTNLNSTYVYDVETGLKLFGKTAFWVKAGDDYATFLRKGEAETFAAANSGNLVTFADAVAGFSTDG
jgi:NitT/TauT family transport system substrate-binding protein